MRNDLLVIDSLSLFVFRHNITDKKIIKQNDIKMMSLELKSSELTNDIFVNVISFTSSLIIHLNYIIIK